MKDSVEMAYFGNLSSSQPDYVFEEDFSPDGKYFAKVTHKASIEEGVTEATIWIFEVEDIQGSLDNPLNPVSPPLALVKMRAAANGFTNDFRDRGNVISQLRWHSEGDSILFLGRSVAENRHLYSVDVRTKKLTKLTPKHHDVFSFSFNTSSYVYLAGKSIDPETEWLSGGGSIPDVLNDARAPLLKLLYPNFRGYDFVMPLDLEVWRVENTEAQPIIDPDTKKPLKISTRFLAVETSLSPSGEFAVVVAADPNMRNGESSENRIGNHSNLSYQIIDLANGRMSQIPKGGINDFFYSKSSNYKAVWSADGKKIVLTELKNVDSENKAVSSQGDIGCALGIYEIEHSILSCIDSPESKFDRLTYDIKWPIPDNLLVTYKIFDQQKFESISLEDHEGAWSKTESGALPIATKFRLTIREDLNTTPKLVATNIHSNQSRIIFDPNPELENRQLGKVIPYEWKDSRNWTIKGGLVLPPDHDSSRRYPLVIQTHGFDPDQFFKVGYSETANAGRAIAARDIIVLQVEEPGSTPAEPWSYATEYALDAYLAAVDQLSSEGLIDPAKVGISGYSHSGWLVANALVQSPNRFAAAVLANTDPVTLTGYFSYVDSNTGLTDLVNDYYVGAQPYKEGIHKWIERVPFFSSDKISTPVLFSATDPWHLIGFWDLYAALRDQKKPVALQYIRTGEHNVSKPVHRYYHQRAIVDWFDFWLNEKIDSEGFESYPLWRELRAAKQ